MGKHKILPIPSALVNHFNPKLKKILAKIYLNGYLVKSI